MTNLKKGDILIADPSVINDNQFRELRLARKDQAHPQQPTLALGLQKARH